eukprot:TRINITY_DN60296_c0_g1_i1.p1 TRINITY_DN60296_c0_g1~~TRINITY_DN60296_c0_g1_i1.p1  ORF type:complete len:124 (+),score=29.60 TRINITY_DN60296_c0_g1_i1:80-451(+)
MGHAWSSQHLEANQSKELLLNQAVGCIPVLSTVYGVPSALAYHWQGDHSEASRRWVEALPLVGNLVHMNIAMLQDDPQTQVPAEARLREMLRADILGASSAGGPVAVPEKRSYPTVELPPSFS